MSNRRHGDRRSRGKIGSGEVDDDIQRWRIAHRQQNLKIQHDSANSQDFELKCRNVERFVSCWAFQGLIVAASDKVQESVPSDSPIFNPLWKWSPGARPCSGKCPHTSTTSLEVQLQESQFCGKLGPSGAHENRFSLYHHTNFANIIFKVISLADR